MVLPLPRMPDPPPTYSAAYMRQFQRVLSTHISNDTNNQQATPSIGQVQVPYAATINLSAAQANVFDVGPLTANVTTFTLTPGTLNQNPDAGIVCYIFVTQGGAGGFTITWPSGAGNNAFKFAGGASTLSVAAGAVDLLTCVYRIISTSTNVGYWYVTLAKAFA